MSKQLDLSVRIGSMLMPNPVTVASHGLGRVTGICSPPENCKEIGPGSFAPISEYGGEDIVQPTQGAGPAWLKREFVE